MAKIQLLSDRISTRIAAGEVVERPASIVKELVENAIDAKATAISVHIEEGGIRLIRVTDNGEGIAEEDMPMAIVKHATSKIYKLEDLEQIHSMGFRGEALASIAAVSMVTIKSRPKEQAAGTELFARGGDVEYIRAAGLPEGTSVTVENLFFNTPARLKFLRRPGAEASQISDIMLRLILGHPNISFRYTAGEKTVYHSPGDGKLKNAIFSVYGYELKDHLLHAAYGHGGVAVEGYICAPTYTFKTTRYGSLYVNGRYIQAPAVSQAVMRAYGERLLKGNYPFYVLKLTLDARDIDVNVHPNKLTIHFKNLGGVEHVVSTAIDDALRANPYGPSIDLGPQPGGGAEGKPKGNDVNDGTARADRPLRDSIKDIAGSAASGLAFGSGQAAGRGDARYDTEYQGARDTGASEEASAPIGEEVSAERATTFTWLNGNGSANGVEEGTDAETTEGQELEPGAPAVSAPPMRADVVREAYTMLEGQRDAAQDTLFARTPVPQGEQLSEEEIADAVDEVLRLAAEKKNKGASILYEPPDFEVWKDDLEALLDEAQKNKQKDASQSASFTSLLNARIVGVVFSTYIIVEAEESVYFIDQHAAHERKLYDQLMQQSRVRVISQKLLAPVGVPLTPEEQLLIEDNLDILTSMGFEIGRVTSTGCLVQAVPQILGELNVTETVQDIIASLSTGETAPALRKDRIAKGACKRAIKGGDAMAEADIMELISTILATGAIPHCPHGRPIAIAMSKAQLETNFKRRV